MGRLKYSYVRFWSKVDKSGGPETCWPWRGAKDRQGYGVTHGERDGYWLAHRRSYALLVSPPGDSCVLHRCDNPACCNPAHLFLGTRGDNNADRHAKGRTARGEQKPGTKLTADAARALVAKRAETGLSYAKLGRIFGIGARAAHHIATGVIWKHATGLGNA